MKWKIKQRLRKQTLFIFGDSPERLEMAYHLPYHKRDQRIKTGDARMKNTIRINAEGVKMIAHRGLSGLERENTAAAFVAAGNRSYYGVETDIHRTKDGRFIVIHDDDTRRVAGVQMIVEETDFDTLRALRLKDKDECERGDLMLPTLEEYIRICKYYDKYCVLELKNHFEEEDIRKIVDIIREIGWLDHVIFISFDLPNMICIRSLLPQQPAQYLVERFDEEILGILKAYRLDLDIYYRAATKECVDACHEAGILVNVWTVDQPQDAERLAADGVDFITSNILE